MNTWIVWMLKCVGLDWSRTPAISGDPSAAEGADHLTLSSKCVRGISSQVAGGRENLLAQKQCRDLSSKLLKTIGNITELVFNFEASSTVAFVPTLKDFHRVAEKSKLLVDSCSNPDWLRAAVLQIHNEEAFREILLEVGLCYNVIHEQAKEMSLSDGLIFEVEDLRLGQTFLPTSETEVVEDQEALRRRLEKYLAKNSGSSNDYILARYLLGRLMKSSISDGRTIEGSTMTNSPILMQMTEKEQRGCWDVANSPIGGGAGAICVSRTKFLGIPCAKKCFLHYEGDLTFWEEASLLASLNHPNIVKFFCCGNTAMISQGESKQCFIGMELLEMSLDEVIKRQAKERQPFPILVALDIILQMARGMLYLHDLGIAHRDIKPYNVVVDEVGNGFFRVKLVDFGMSKTKLEVSKSNTVSRKGCGTTKYRAPEAFPDAADAGQGKQKVKWFRADVYSFAVTCSVLLSREEPYPGVTGTKLYRKLVNKMEPLRPKLEPVDCPKVLFELLEECWATTPGARPRFEDICKRLEKYKHDLLKGPNVVKKGLQTLDRFHATSYSYIDKMLAKRSELRIPVTGCDEDFASTPGDLEADANSSDDESQPLDQASSGLQILNLEWITSHKKKFIVTQVPGDDAEFNAALERACKEFLKQINLSVIPSTEERGQVFIDAVRMLRSKFPKYNAMVVYPKHHQNFEECAQCSIGLRLNKFFVGSAQVYVFKRGDFTLLGDGGYINWCFGGNYKRDDNKVTFWDIPSNENEG